MGEQTRLQRKWEAEQAKRPVVAPNVPGNRPKPKAKAGDRARIAADSKLAAENKRLAAEVKRLAAKDAVHADAATPTASTPNATASAATKAASET